MFLVKDSLKWYRKHLFQRKNLSNYWNKAEESANIKARWITVEIKGKLTTHAGFWHWGNDYAQISSIIIYFKSLCQSVSRIISYC